MSLRARALRLLARREHSRAELAAKLLPHAGTPEDVEAVLAEFQDKGWLNETRLVDAVVSARRSRFGAARVLQELRRKGLGEDELARARAALAGGEMAAARAVWAKKFGHPARSAAERAKQARFLAGRGFAPEVVRKVVGGREDD